MTFIRFEPVCRCEIMKTALNKEENDLAGLLTFSSFTELCVLLETKKKCK